MKTLTSTLSVFLALCFVLGCAVSQPTTTGTLATVDPSSVRPDIVQIGPDPTLAIHGLPENWPTGVYYRPNRHFGPWLKGSDFEKIQILLDGTGATWYFNDYFSSMTQTKQKAYKHYYRTDFTSHVNDVRLLSNQTPVIDHEPGGAPDPTQQSQVEANRVLFSLVGIRASSRYGGSLQLIFRLASITTSNQDTPHKEDFEYELGYYDAQIEKQLLFDLGQLRMSVFVTPKPERLNPHRYHSGKGIVHVNFEPTHVVAYQDGRIIDSAEAETALEKVFDALGEAVASAPSGNYSHAERFASGFLHDQFINEFNKLTEPDDKVDRLMISDNFIDLDTSKGIPVVWLSFRITTLNSWTDFFQDDEFKVTFSTTHFYGAREEYQGLLLKKYECEETDENFASTPWVTLGEWLIPECIPLTKVENSVRIAEQDDLLNFNDFLNSSPIELQAPDCSIVQHNINEGIFSPIEIETGTENLYQWLKEEEGAKGYFHWKAIWGVGLR